MAQDLYAAFGIGEDDRHISAVDADGVALAAIQGLYQLVLEKDDLLADQERQIAALEGRLAALEDAVRADGSAARPLAASMWLACLLLGSSCLAGVTLWRRRFRKQVGGG
jgi:hypothetical protein